jgi:hypothetical protein
MALPGTIGAQVFGGEDINTSIEEYESLSSRTASDPVDEDVIATIPYYCSEMIQKTIKMIHRFSAYESPDCRLRHQQPH